MFLCRHLHRQVCIFKTSRSIIQLRNHAPFLRTSTFRGTATSSTFSITSFLPTPGNPNSSRPSSFTRPLPDAYNDIDLHKYVNLTPQNRELVPERVLTRLLIQSVESNGKHITTLCQDILKLDGPRSNERDRLLRRLLISTNLEVLPGDTVLEILRHFTVDDTLQGFSDLDILSLTYSVIWHLKPGPLADEIRAILYTAVLARLQVLQPASGGVDSVTHKLPDIISSAFELLHHLLNLRDEAKVLELFQALVERLYIPPEAVHQAPADSPDFVYIVSVTLARACLYWDKRLLAHRLLLSLLPSETELVSIVNARRRELSAANSESASPSSVTPRPPLDLTLIDLIIDTLYTTLRSPSRPELRLCVELICRIHPISPVPNGIIRLAYTATADLKDGDPARRLYSFTRDLGVSQDYQYPAPQGPAILSLMQFLTEQKGNTHLARMLAHEVAENSLFLPVHSRAEFIAIAAAHGFSVSARTLWERYSGGKDKQVILGAGRLMVRMVSLFTRISRRTEMLLEQRATESPEGGFLDDHSMQERIKDTAALADRVLNEFIECHRPLEKANHQHLTSLARAYFITGRFEEGFYVFRLLLRRKELPDVHDVNVALTALAEHRPRSAAIIIDRMVEKGLEPDRVTFGTVLHHALLLGDLKLVEQLAARARELGDIRLSLKGLTSAIRASVAPDIEAPVGSRVPQLEENLKLLETMPNKGIVSSPQIGKYMVYAALRENETVLAFKFWSLLLKLSAEWEDREHVFIKRLLRRRLRQMEKNQETDNMMRELTARPPYHGMK